METKTNCRIESRVDAGVDERGNAVIETTLMLPWILLFFILVFDYGFYAVTLISVENAVRVGAHQATRTAGSASDNTVLCQVVLNELRWLPNIGQSVTTCTGSDPVQVTTTLIEDGSPSPITGDLCPTSVDGTTIPPCAEVTVTYTTPQLFPLPWLLGKMTVRRIAQMRVRSS